MHRTPVTAHIGFDKRLTSNASGQPRQDLLWLISLICRGLELPPCLVETEKKKESHQPVRGFMRLSA